MRKPSLILCVALIAALLLAPAASAKVQYTYAVKFVCGYNGTNIGVTDSGPAGEPPVKLGNYATEVNLVWPEIYLTDQQAHVEKHVILLVDRGKVVGREPSVVTPSAYDTITLPSLGATMDDCNRLAFLLWGTVPTPFPITIGYLVLQSTHEIDVTAVYTSQVCSAYALNTATAPKFECLDASGKFQGVSNSIDIERIPGRILLGPNPPPPAP
ncbi:MAG TPA: hypothetical protein VGS22_00135 [Thermoanaerobaculia bacterium]|jgi:hypothetical protein|nr:hypothetical protein [Thermoanaerobaculia bacterium]